VDYSNAQKQFDRGWTNALLFGRDEKVEPGDAPAFVAKLQLQQQQPVAPPLFVSASFVRFASSALSSNRSSPHSPLKASD